jgi:hydroxyethylthiazole kinase
VVTSFTANALLAIGASPLMAHAPEELEEISKISNALVLNIGTLDHEQIDNMLMAIEYANQNELPIIIDPVGSGASQLRTQTVKALLEKANNSILKGNASEIISLTTKTASKGVDSLAETSEALQSARELLKIYSLRAVTITGEDDYVLDADNCFKHSNGSEMMAKVTGMGCILTAIVAAFCAVNPDKYLAVRQAITYAGIVGQLTAIECKGPGSFQPLFLDKLHSLKQGEIEQTAKVQPC